MSTQIAHTSYTDKKGFFWRKRYVGEVLSVSLRTKEESVARARAAAITIRFMELETMLVPSTAIKEALVAYRDSMLRHEKLALLQAMVRNATGSAETDFNAVPVQNPILAVQEPVKALHALSDVKKAYFEANTEWTNKTIQDYTACIERFIKWSGDKNIEEVSKDTVIEFKAHMDEIGLAPNTKQKILVRLSSMFSYAVDVKEWISKNPVTGLNYKKVSNVTKKEEITTEQFKQAQQHPLTANNSAVFWANAIMFYTGIRVSELCQLTKNDYVEIEGIKCISINDAEEGKSTKTETSKRNIPLCDALLALGVWDVKPVMKTGLNSVMDKCSKSFKNIGLKRSTHCFRHSLSNRLRDTECEDSTRYFILGHAAATMTDRVYISRLPLQKMLDALNQANA